MAEGAWVDEAPLLRSNAPSLPLGWTCGKGRSAGVEVVQATTFGLQIAMTAYSPIVDQTALEEVGDGVVGEG